MIGYDRNLLIFFFLAESIRNKVGACLPLFGWKKNEIENNPLFTEILRLFRKVHFIGYDINGEWASINILVSQPY